MVPLCSNSGFLFAFDTLQIYKANNSSFLQTFRVERDFPRPRLFKNGVKENLLDVQLRQGPERHFWRPGHK